MCAGAVLSAKSQSDKELQSARSEARNIIHALHKCREKLSTVEVSKEGRKEGRMCIGLAGSTIILYMYCMYYVYVMPNLVRVKKKVSVSDGSYSELL